LAQDGEGVGEVAKLVLKKAKEKKREAFGLALEMAGYPLFTSVQEGKA
jgi:hypothetical protein